MRSIVIAFVVVAGALLSGCASSPRGSAPSVFGTSAPKPPSPLVSEEKWLHEWFNGTPVEIGSQVDGSLRVAVPLRNSFDTGQAKVKPALGAVLDKVAVSMRRQPGAKIELTAPADANVDVRARSQSLQNYLVSKGVRSDRIVRTGAPAHMVELRLVPGAQPIEKLEDLPTTGSGTYRPPVRGIKAGR